MGRAKFMPTTVLDVVECKYNLAQATWSIMNTYKWNKHRISAWFFCIAIGTSSGDQT